MNKLRILLLALAYACFWSLFVLFPYPANVLPESHASYVAGPVFASNLITLVTMALMGGVLVVFRDSLAERVAGSTAAIVGSGALLLAWRGRGSLPQPMRSGARAGGWLLTPPSWRLTA